MKNPTTSSAAATLLIDLQECVMHVIFPLGIPRSCDASLSQPSGRSGRTRMVLFSARDELRVLNEAPDYPWTLANSEATI
jgi:hypothetical protein